jgi:hypothetical protein
LTLRWDAPDECPQGPWVLKRVSTLEGSARPRRLSAEGSVWREGKRYRLRLVVHDVATSERSFDSASCADLAGAAAVHLSLLLHDTGTSSTANSAAASSASGASPSNALPSNASPSGASESNSQSEVSGAKTGRSEASSAERPPAPAAPVASSVKSPGEATPGTERPRSWHVGLAAPLGTLNLGPSPKTSFGLGAGVTLTVARWQLYLTGEFDAKQRLVHASSPEYSSVVVRQAASASLCYAWHWGTVDLAPCAALWLEHVSARGDGPDVIVHTAHTWWVSPAAAGFARWRWMPSIALLGSLNLRVEGARPRFSIEGLDDVEQFVPVSLAVALGPEWIF